MKSLVRPAAVVHASISPEPGSASQLQSTAVPRSREGRSHMALRKPEWPVLLAQTGGRTELTAAPSDATLCDARGSGRAVRFTRLSFLPTVHNHVAHLCKTAASLCV